jgi:polyhydroxyalkanoate synthesis regulator phasin
MRRLPVISKRLNPVVSAVIVVLLSLGMPTLLAGQGRATAQKSARGIAQSKQDRRQLQNRIMGIKDEQQLDTALANLVAAGRITREQAAKLKAQWQKRQGNARTQTVISRLRNIKDEGKLNEALDKLIANGKITQEQAAKIRERWQNQQKSAGAVESKRKSAIAGQKRQKNAGPAQALEKIRDLKNEAKVDKVLGKLVDKGRITQDQAAKIKEQWKKRR